MSLLCFFYFFFSSRRRHTRSYGDWSSDVCSSDLLQRMALFAHRPGRTPEGNGSFYGPPRQFLRSVEDPGIFLSRMEKNRSEERRVGKECRSRWASDHHKKNREMSNRAIMEK